MNFGFGGKVWIPFLGLNYDQVVFDVRPFSQLTKKWSGMRNTTCTLCFKVQHSVLPSQTDSEQHYFDITYEINIVLKFKDWRRTESYKGPVELIRFVATPASTSLTQAAKVELRPYFKG